MRVPVLALTMMVMPVCALGQQPVRYEPTEKDLKFVYATVPAVAIVSSERSFELRPFEECFLKIVGRMKSSTKTTRRIGRRRWKFAGIAEA